MRLLSSAIMPCVLVSAVILTGCQSLQPSQKSSHSMQSSETTQLYGKIGVRTPQQTGSAFYSWVQNHNEFEIELSGMLGMGKTLIQGQKDGAVRLDSAKTGLIQAYSAEELLQQATGWQAPISYLLDWVHARPASQQATLQHDTQQRITQINEAGWQVQLSYQEQNTLPNRLILVQKLENNQENRITMTIQNR